MFSWEGILYFITTFSRSTTVISPTKHKIKTNFVISKIASLIKVVVIFVNALHLNIKSTHGCNGGYGEASCPPADSTAC